MVEIERCLDGVVSRVWCVGRVGRSLKYGVWVCVCVSGF